MRSFRVVWEIDVEADDAKGAAEMARYLQTLPETTAVIFDVIDEAGETKRIDLLSE